jgi:predicted lipoprotein with Yx(FWY)xxD motif
MKRTVALLAALVLTSACGADPEPTADAPSPEQSASPTPSERPPETDETTGTNDPPASKGTRLVLAPSPFGEMVFDAEQQAIYLFDVETTDEPRCYGECAEAWPPVLTTGDPVTGAGLRDGLVGTTRRTDGSTQVTYGGHPLYYYAHEGPGEVKCHDVFLNGGTWYAVGADGARLP